MFYWKEAFSLVELETRSVFDLEQAFMEAIDFTAR